MTSTMLSVVLVTAIAGPATAQQRTNDDWTEQAFRDLDRNNDGRVTTDEWSFDRDAFRRADHNGDGVVTRREFLGMDDDAREDRVVDDQVEARRFDLLDADRDNRISRREWRESRAAFDAVDENRDGVLTRAELASQSDDVAIGAAERFVDLDVDRSGAITRGEWLDSAAGFTRLDTNRDGRLSRAEYAQGGRDAGNRRTGSGVDDGVADRATPAWRAGYQRGLAEGRVAGREDRTRGQWDLDGQRELEQADSGYDTSVGSRADYQAGYRAAFRVGYREGYGRS
jgi:Ca2+-binding EF-hand superfamily protein